MITFQHINQLYLSQTSKIIHKTLGFRCQSQRFGANSTPHQINYNIRSVCEHKIKKIRAYFLKGSQLGFQAQI